MNKATNFNDSSVIVRSMILQSESINHFIDWMTPVVSIHSDKVIYYIKIAYQFFFLAGWIKSRFPTDSDKIELGKTCWMLRLLKSWLIANTIFVIYTNRLIATGTTTFVDVLQSSIFNWFECRDTASQFMLLNLDSKVIYQNKKKKSDSELPSTLKI